MKIHNWILCMVPLALVFLSSCQAEFQEIHYGRDECDHCKMTIMDKRFAAELISSKGKAYKFDDIHCLGAFMRAKNYTASAAGKIYIMDFSLPGTPVAIGQARLIRSDALQSPMAGHTAAFASEDSMRVYQQQYQAEKLIYTQIIP